MCKLQDIELWASRIKDMSNDIAESKPFIMDRIPTTAELICDYAQNIIDALRKEKFYAQKKLRPSDAEAGERS
jgi:hypothetical protein